MPRDLVVCCGGTANEFARDHTNVLELFSALVHDPERQLAYYHPGVGTTEAAGALTSAARSVSKLLGKAIGYGDYARATPDALMPESLEGWWHPAEFVPKARQNRARRRLERRMNLFRRRTLPAEPLAHDVAFLRDGYKLPPGAVRVRTDPIA
jgi:hypothetical protein